MTTTKRQVEVFTAGCSCCNDTVQLVQSLACENCEVTVLDMNAAATADRAKELGVNRVPAVAINGQLAGCCSNAAPNPQTLQEAGIGQSL